MDIVAMIVKDINEIPKDDYTNILLLEEKKFISHSLLQKNFYRK